MSGMSPEDVMELKHLAATLADLLRTYFKELRRQGFTDKEALQITMGWQREIFGDQDKDE